jgi:hypothetical protein
MPAVAPLPKFLIGPKRGRRPDAKNVFPVN